MRVRCISDFEKLLTVGKEYEVSVVNDNDVSVTNDRGTVVVLPKALFGKPIKEKVVRKSKKKIEVDESFVETKGEINVYKEPVLDIAEKTVTIIENLNETLEESKEGFEKLVEKSEDDVVEYKED